MKRFFLLFIIASISIGSFAQLIAKGNFTKNSTTQGIDYVFIYEKLDNSSEIHYKSKNPGEIVRWFHFSNGIKTELFNFSTLSSTETYIDPKHNSGYILLANGKEISFWVLDKSQANDWKNSQVEDPSGYKISIGNSEKPGNNTSNSSADNSNNENSSQIPAIDEIGCKITTTTLERDSTNENQRPKSTTLEGSAPLDIQFFSNPTGDVRNFLWQIYKDGVLILTRTEQNHQYVFNQTGKYKVRLQVSNNTTTASDSIDVSVSESVMAIPKVFTPNGDGKNDEFRVAYTSIIEFNATIINRWGRVVFKWTDPQRGWDGTIGGKPAPEGTYFYVIQAKGSDGKPYLRKGHINLLR